MRSRRECKYSGGLRGKKSENSHFFTPTRIYSFARFIIITIDEMNVKKFIFFVCWDIKMHSDIYSAIKQTTHTHPAQNCPKIICLK